MFRVAIKEYYRPTENTENCSSVTRELGETLDEAIVKLKNLIVVNEDIKDHLKSVKTEYVIWGD